MLVEATYSTAGGTRQVAIKQRGRDKEMTVDGAPVKDRRHMVGTIPCVVFCHDDIAFVAGAPEMQRWFMNQTAALLDPYAVDEVRRYSRILRSRNVALRERRVELLDVLDTQLAEAGAKIQHRRAALQERFSDIVSDVFGEVFEQDAVLTMKYRPSWDVPGEQDDEGKRIPAIVDVLSRRRGRDLDMATSTSGPHRDRFDFLLANRIFTEVASTGQLRLVSLILRIVQLRLLAEAAQQLPVILLDDVLLELDPRRRSRLLTTMPRYQQAFYTFLPDEQYAQYMDDSTLVYAVKDGIIQTSGTAHG
jgi:DNA replication and repair protein RecF